MVKKKTKDSLTVAVPQQKQPAPVDIQNDEYRGMGGSYVIDPATGKRIRVEGPELEQAPTAQELEKMEAIDDESE